MNGTKRTPPTIETHLNPRGEANFLASLSICCANSRVGAMMSAYGPKCLLSSVKGGKLEMKASIGMTKAAVLPEPVSMCKRCQFQVVLGKQPSD